ncbi:deoxynucleoside kinase [Biformimicrobium ophioploci]|uniref:Deoxynucleoside kinase n=1 Tax=Biformimicrobium ophioploci TaxID=3036711 RepID=A0ABQ6LWD2_9GAMM|nr:deoxynucleoside kinase [Microbulbifer sp. NKW57]GMG86424.1 deoxynucleoside kinase [Microbulbifer sp. NKW57]
MATEQLESEWHPDLTGRTVPRYIAIEGNIGSGKTSLARRLALTLGYDTLLEDASSNPFLEKFYQGNPATALPNQLYFLLQRSREIQSLRQEDLFAPTRVADFIVEKDQLFASVTLDEDEMRLYRQVYEQLTLQAPQPDLVVYLQAPVSVLQSRIRKRGVAVEQNITPDYLARLNDAYTNFFHYYDATPLLIVNCADIDIINNDEDYRQLVETLLNTNSGRHYYNPRSR